MVKNFVFVVEWKHNEWGWFPFHDTFCAERPYAERKMNEWKKKEPGFEYRISKYIREE